MLGLTFSSKLDWGSSIISIAKTASNKIGDLISFMKLHSPDVALYLSINLPHGHSWNTAVMTGLVLLVATPNCQISYKNEFIGNFVPSHAASLEPLKKFDICFCIFFQHQRKVYLYGGDWKAVSPRSFQIFLIFRCFLKILSRKFFSNSSKFLILKMNFTGAKTVKCYEQD